MLGLIGFAFMLAISIIYFNEIGWPVLAGAWAIILFLPLLVFIGVPGFLVLLVQIVVVAGVYIKAKNG